MKMQLRRIMERDYSNKNVVKREPNQMALTHRPDLVSVQSMIDIWGVDSFLQHLEE